MLQHETARSVYEEIKGKAVRSTRSEFHDFYKMFLKSATEYASIRTSWAIMNQSGRNEDDKFRRIKHDAFISILSALARNMDINIEEIMPDRKSKGDFACYIALFLALEQR